MWAYTKAFPINVYEKMQTSHYGRGLTRTQFSINLNATVRSHSTGEEGVRACTS